jgi:single-strand DNA-binding protein
MNNLNLMVIEGNLVKDPLTRTTKSGDKVCAFSIATNRYYKTNLGTEKDTSFFDIEAWGKQAEVCQRLGHKGRFCRATGRLRQDKWNTSSGESRSKVVIVAELIEFRPEHKKEEGSENEQ